MSSETTYDKADQLTHKMLDNDIGGEVLMLDSDTYRDFKSELYKFHSFYTYPTDEKEKWRGLSLEVHHFMQPVSLECDIPITAMNERQPFLMAIRYRKSNGRIGYLDHEDTDPRWR